MWWSRKPKEEPPAEVEKLKFLDELPPKFDDLESVSQPKVSPLKEAWGRVSMDDFKPSSLLTTPCFREAGLAGFTSMAVFGSIIFLYHKSPRRAANWAMGGFLLGSVIGWEQCNSIRRQSSQATDMARQAYEGRQKAKLAEKYKEFKEMKERESK